MSGDGLPTGTFHDRMALFKGKEKATGNKPPVLTPKPAGERHTPSTLKTEFPKREVSEDKVNSTTTENETEGDDNSGRKSRSSSSAPESVGKLSDNRWKPVDKSTTTSKAVPIIMPKASSPTHSSASTASSTTTASPDQVEAKPEQKSSIKDKIATFANPSPAPEKHDTPPERRGSGTSSRIAALAGAVNVSAIGPRPIMPAKIAPSSSVAESNNDRTSPASVVAEKSTPEKSETVTEVKPATEADEKPKPEPKRPQSIKIAALGGLVNVNALGGAPRHVSPARAALPAVVPEDLSPQPEHHQTAPALPTVKEEDETAEKEDTTARSTPVPETSTPATTVAASPVESTTTTSTSEEVKDPVAVLESGKSLVLTRPEDTPVVPETTSGEGQPAATSSDASKPEGSEAPQPEVDPTFYFSKRDALRTPMTPVTPSKPGEKTNLISSRISTLALGVNVGALRPDAPRPLNPHNKRREDGSSPSNAAGGFGGFDATQDLARRVLASQSQASGEELTHMNMARATKPKSRPPSRKISGDFKELSMSLSH